MKKFSKILCPYDFSKNAEESLLFALKMADNDTEITLLHIIQLPYFIDPNGFTYYDVKSDEIRKTTEDALEQKLKAIRSLYPEYNIVYKIELHFKKNITRTNKIELDNDPAEFIVNTQKKDGFDLIVMGTHGRKGLGRLLMGSVAESVLRGATCPVLTIKHV